MRTDHDADGTPVEEMSDSTRRIQDHLHEITDELLHGKNSHEDPDLPENWERLEHGGNLIDLEQDEATELHVAPERAQQQDAVLRNAEAVGGQAPI